MHSAQYVCVCVLKWAVVEVCRGLAEAADGNVLSRSHEELQLVNKTGSANDCMSTCVFVGVFFLFFALHNSLWK